MLFTEQSTKRSFGRVLRPPLRHHHYHLRRRLRRLLPHRYASSETAHYSCFFFVPLIFVGCSDKPSESDGRAKLESRIQQQSNALIRVASFQKTDGVLHDMMEYQYQMSYTAEVEFLDDVMWSGGNNLMGWTGDFIAKRGQPKPPQNVFGQFFDLNEGMKGAKKGERLDSRET